MRFDFTMDSKRFSCIKCGKCCVFSQNLQENAENKDDEFIEKKIPVYPEEADILEILAKDNDIQLSLLEDNVLPDTLNQRIVVTRYQILLDEDNNYRCPFSKNNLCTIYDNRPLVCRAYPVSSKEIEGFNREIFIDPKCSGIDNIRDSLENLIIEDIKQIFPLEYRAAVKIFNREKQIMLKLRELVEDEEIFLNEGIRMDEFDEALKNWDRTILYTETDF